MIRNRPTLSQTDKLCLVALAGIVLTVVLTDLAMDVEAYKAAEADRPPAITLTASAINCTPLVEAVELARESAQIAPYDDETIPLYYDLQTALRDACKANNVPLCLALGLIEIESDFDPYADNSLCFGFYQLNKNYYPDDLTPEENIRAGVAHLAGQIERYDGDIQAALRAYNLGWDDGDRQYARAVLDASEKWGNG